MDASAWYVVQTQANRESCAERSLGRVNVEVFSPRMTRPNMIRGRRRLVTGALFPGYLFARFAIETHYRAVSYAHGVQKLVAFGLQPVTVSDALIAAIRARLDEPPADPRLFVPGQTVRIQQGPLQGLEAIFEQELTDRERAVVLLRTLSYQARVVVELGSVATV